MNLEESNRLCKRNLLAVSIFISFYYFAGLEIKSISFFGAKSTLDNNHAIILTLWAVWMYFLLRYVQFYITFGHTAIKKVKEEILHSGLISLLTNLNTDKLKALEVDHYAKNLNVKFCPFISFGNPRNNGQKSKRNYKMKRLIRKKRGHINFLNYKIVYQKHPRFIGGQWNFQIIFSNIVYEDPDGVRGEYWMSLSQTRTAFLQIFTTYMVHPATSEYLLPIFLAFGPLVFLFHAW